MKTILDLLSEFGTLNDAKIEKGGKLSEKSLKRWSELKKFYDLIMGQNGISRGTVTRRFAAAEIGEEVTRRKHLRVPMAMDIVFEKEGQYHSGRVINLSSGGVFLRSDTIVDIGSKVVLHLANFGRGFDAVMTIKGEVKWKREGEDESDLPQGMGIQFLDVPEDIQRRLDSFVLEVLEKHLCGLSSDLLDPEFLERENIKL